MIATVLISTLLGALSSLGIGGGSLLILWLTLVRHMDYTSAKCINLLFFIPPAIISFCFAIKSHSIQIQSVFPAAILGCISTFLFSYFSSSWNTDQLKKIYGALLIVIAVRELIISFKK